MAVVTLRPSATLAHTGTLTGGAGTAHATTDDDPANDATYSTLDGGENYVVELTDLTVPAGNRISSVNVRLRARNSGSLPSASVLVRLLTPGSQILFSATPLIFWTDWVTFTVQPGAGATTTTLTETHLDVAYLQVLPLEFGNPPGTAIDLSEAYVDVVLGGPPTVTFAQPAGGTTITTDDTPLFIWGTALDPLSGPHTASQVKVFTDAVASGGGFDPDTSTAVLDSGTIPGPNYLYTFDTEPLANGDYWGYVRASQTVDGLELWSDWDTGASEFTIDVDRPDNPDVIAAGQPSRGRIDIHLSPGPDTSTVTHAYEVQRSTDNGETWENIRTLVGFGLVFVDGDPMHVFDYEAPNGTDVRYRVRTQHLYDFVGGVGHSAWSYSTTLFWESNDWWLKHPTNPSLNRKIVIRSQPSRTRTSRNHAFQVLGRRNPVVVTDVPLGWSGELVLWVDDDDQRFNLDRLLSTGDPILIQAPRIVKAWQDTWATIGDVGRERAIDSGSVDLTWEALPFTEVDRPEGNLTIWT